MYTSGLKRVMFEEASASSDWRFPYRLIVPGQTEWRDDVDEVVLGMSPDYAAWDDYGRMQTANAPTPDFWNAPFYSASSDDASGVVRLVDPNLIDIVVPYGAIRQMGPGGVSVGVQHRDKVSGSRTTLLVGRLPLLSGVI